MPYTAEEFQEDAQDVFEAAKEAADTDAMVGLLRNAAALTIASRVMRPGFLEEALCHEEYEGPEGGREIRAKELAQSIRAALTGESETGG